MFIRLASHRKWQKFPPSTMCREHRYSDFLIVSFSLNVFLDEGDLMAYKVEIIVQYSHHDGSLH